MMQRSGVPSNDITYCALMEACVLSHEPDMALRVFKRALNQGITHSLQVTKSSDGTLTCLVSQQQLLA